MNELKKTARIAGLYYLLAAITGAFSMLYVPGVLIVAGDAAATAHNILASELLFRSGLVSGLACQVFFVLQALTLHKLLRAVNAQHAALMVALVVVAVPIACLNLLNPFAALNLLTGTDYGAALGLERLRAQAMLSLDLYNDGILIAEVFWGLWLLPFGMLVIKSGFIPRILGVLLILACAGYLLDCVVHFLFPHQAAMVTPIATTPSAVAELSMISWLLIKGVRPRQAAIDKVG